MLLENNKFFLILKPHRHLWVNCLGNMGTSTSHGLWASTGCYRLLLGQLYLLFLYIFPFSRVRK
jgi:hypothetical protein